MGKFATRLALAIAAMAAALAVALFAAMSFVDSPTYAWRLVAYGESDTRDAAIFPARAVARAGTPSAIPPGPPFALVDLRYPYRGADHQEPFSELLARTGTSAFLIVQNDRLVFEAYGENASRDSISTSFSVAKSFDSALIGAAIADGFIGSVDDRVVRYVPEIAGRGLDALTIRHLLTMSTGIRYASDDERPFFMAPFGDDARTYYSPDLRRLALGVAAGDTPVGAGFRYNNYHPLLEGLILERTVGTTVAQYLERRIWQPIGAEFDASWSLDSAASGFEKMESGINARAIDFARFGLLFLHRGRWNGAQILPEAWVQESTSPGASDTREWEVFAHWPRQGGYYAYHWWGLNNPDGSRDYMALGKFDQAIYVAERKNAVIVRLGEARDAAVSWPLVIHAIVDRLP